MDKTHASNPARKFRWDIEGLRAIAVMVVIFFHCGLPGVRGGFVGVDIFFVLSGYLITGLLVADLQVSGTLNMARFYARRARRLLPVSLLVLLVSILAARIILPPLDQDILWKSALATACYNSNNFFVLTSGNYFGHALASNPFLHTWSLAVEEQFYLIWPLLLLAFYKVSRNKKTLAALLLLLCALSLGLCIWLTYRANYLAFFLAPARGWEFGLGGLASLIPDAWLRQRPRLAMTGGIAGILVLLVSVMFIREEMAFPGWIALIPAVGTILALLSGAGVPGRGIGRVLNTAPVQFVGGLSYSLYLWHWPILVFARAHFEQLSASVIMGCLVLTFALAYGGYRLVENPIRYFPYLLSRTSLTFTLSAAATLLCVATVMGWKHWVEHNPQMKRFSVAVHDLPAVYKRGCQTEMLNPKPKSCTFMPDGVATQRVVLFGDSHAAQWFPALEEIALQHHWTVVTFLKGACPPVDVRIYAPGLHRENFECHEWYERSVAQIAAVHPKLIVISFATWYEEVNDPHLPLSGGSWETGITKTLGVLTRDGASVRLLRDTPHPEFDVPDCLARLDWTGRGTCPPMTRQVNLDSHVFQAEEKAVSGRQDASVLDLTKKFCGAVYCPIEQPSGILYRDNNHLVASYIRELAPTLAFLLSSDT